jgi:hypothetical protein
MSSIPNRAVHVVASLGLAGMLMLAGSGCQSAHKVDPLATLNKETAPSQVVVSGPVTEPATAPSSAVAAPVRETATGPYTRAEQPKSERKELRYMGVDRQHYDLVQPDPPIDAATEVRNWSRGACYYPSGAAVAFPNYTLNKNLLPAQLHGDGPEAVLDPLIFMGDTIALPVMMVIVPPWKEVVYRGIFYPPTMTASPPQ